MHVPDPRTATYGAICAQILVTKQEIQRLSKDALALQQQHLHNRIANAEQNNEPAHAKALLNMLQHEAKSKEWGSINRVMHPPQGGNPLLIQVQTPSGPMTYDTEENIFHHENAHLSIRFHLAYSAPCYSSQLLKDIGHLSNTQCSKDILNGTYAYPPDTDQWTVKILQEAHYTYKLFCNHRIDGNVSVHNFQSYWQGANKRISSSFSCLHFGHYKAASSNKHLSALHAAKLTACTRHRTPLGRWSVGLTVLIEKVHGNNNIGKMHAICLLEADFNFYNKLIFARRMMSSAQSKGQISVECFTTKGNNCINAVITKMMLCDELQTHHHPTCIGGNDFADCYDRIAHPPASIALKSWGIPREAIWVLLIAMQMMRFFLCTGFGESSESYGGSMEDSTLGLG
jgi:hypothetical protein